MGENVSIRGSKSFTELYHLAIKPSLIGLNLVPNYF